MNNKLIHLPLAKNDISKVFRWYERQSCGLGSRFLSEMDDSFESIRCFPESYEIIHANYHRALVNKFPYAIYFEHLNDEVIVYAVIHTSRHSRAWRRRLP